MADCDRYNDVKTQVTVTAEAPKAKKPVICCMSFRINLKIETKGSKSKICEMSETKAESKSKNPKKANLSDHSSIKHLLDESVSEVDLSLT